MNTLLAWWSPCLSYDLPSRLMSWKWSMHFKLDIVKDIRYSMYIPRIGRERRNLSIPMLTLRMPISILKMKILNTFFLEIQISNFYQVVCFLWDGNHKLQAWLPYIQHVHHENLEWYYLVDSIVFNTSHALVELLITMTNLNKSISTLPLCFEFSMCVLSITLCSWFRLFNSLFHNNTYWVLQLGFTTMS